MTPKSSMPVAALAILIFMFVLSSAALSQKPAGAIGHPPPGKLIDIGGYRLHIKCMGKGGPAVILVAGGGDFSFDWSLVQSSVSRFARACSYDRAGLAWSDLGPVPRTMRQEAYELHTLLLRAGVKPPYILVGHSVGGLIVRVYADQFPKEVAGVVLVDPTHEDTTLMYRGKIVRVREGAKGRPIPPVQTMSSSPPKPPTEEDLKQLELNRQVFGPPKIAPPYDKLPSDIQQLRLWALSNPKHYAATEDFWAEELQALYDARTKTKYPLGDRPLIVLMQSSKEGQTPPPGLPLEQWKSIVEEKRKQKLGLVNLSRNGKVIVAENSSHHIQLDEPEIVIEAVREVLDAVRRRTKLTP